MVALSFKTFDQIVAEMMDWLVSAASPITDLNIGSATRTFMEALAVPLAENNVRDQELVKRFYVQTATGAWLDMRAAELGMSRILAAPTLRLVTASHTAGASVTIPVGTLFKTLPGASVQVIYQVTAQAVLPTGSASVNVSVVSTTTGAATAIPDGTALQQTGTFLAGIGTLLTSTITSAGVDQETDTALRARVLDRIQHPLGPGTSSDYREWALMQPGIVSVSVLPLWNGPGTVEVLVLGPANTIPSASTIAAVQAAIDPAPSGSGAGLAPIGAYVTVIAPALATVDVQVVITAGSGFDTTAVRANVVTAIRTYINALGVGETVKYAALSSVIWTTAGVGGLLGIDGGNYTALVDRVSPAAYAASDIVIGSSAKAVPGTIVAN